MRTLYPVCNTKVGSTGRQLADAIIRCLKNCRMMSEVNEFTTQAYKLESYEEVFSVGRKYVFVSLTVGN